MATTPFSAPLDFYADDNSTVIGNETDIAQLIADGLGLKLELVPTDWANWPLATQSGDVDVTISNVTVTEERKQLFDFSSYRVDDLGFLAKAGSDLEITEPADVAGLTVAVGSGTNQEKILLAWDQQNRAAGLKPVDVQYFQNDSDTTLALQSGRIDLSFGPNATAAYKAATAPDDFLVVGTVNGGWPDTAQIAVATAQGQRAGARVHRRAERRHRRRQLREGARPLGPERPSRSTSPRPTRPASQPAEPIPGRNHPREPPPNHPRRPAGGRRAAAVRVQQLRRHRGRPAGRVERRRRHPGARRRHQPGTGRPGQHRRGPRRRGARARRDLRRRQADRRHRRAPATRRWPSWPTTTAPSSAARSTSPRWSPSRSGWSSTSGTSPGSSGRCRCRAATSKRSSATSA